MSSRTLFLAGAVMATLAAPAGAQDWRTVTSFRQRADEAALDVHVRYGAGRLLIGPSTAGGELYRVGLHYDSDLFDPITEYATGRLEVGVEGTGRSIRLRNNEAGELDLRHRHALPERPVGEVDRRPVRRPRVGRDAHDLVAQLDAAALAQAQTLRALQAALEELQPDMRNVLLLVALDELSYEEAAVMLSIPVGTVRSRVSRARSSLRKRLKEQSIDLGF